jgi:hypothetical protein
MVKLVEDLVALLMFFILPKSVPFVKRRALGMRTASSFVQPRSRC